MLESLYQIDFITSGGSLRLLDVGDLIEKPIQFPAVQQAAGFSGIGRLWGLSAAAGGGRRQLEWSRYIEHASHAAAASYAIAHPPRVMTLSAGKLRISITGGAVWELMDAVLSAAACGVSTAGNFETLASYTVEGGNTLPVSGVPHAVGDVLSWVTETHTSIATPHSGM